jgi:hypothetical protein
MLQLRHLQIIVIFRYQQYCFYHKTVYKEMFMVCIFSAVLECSSVAVMNKDGSVVVLCVEGMTRYGNYSGSLVVQN